MRESAAREAVSEVNRLLEQTARSNTDAGALKVNETLIT